MLGQSLPEYIFILSSISLLRLVAPSSFLYLSYCLYTKSITPWWLFLFALLEASFYLFVYRPRRTVLQKSIYTPPPLTRAQRHALFLQCSKRIAGSRYPLGWFTSPNIKRQNVVEWILWALFSATPETAQESWEDEMEEYVTKVEELLGMKLEQGRVDATSALRLTLDPVKMVHRPLIWYLVVALVDLITSLKLHLMGFTHYSNPSRIFPPRLFHIFTTPSPSATTHFSYWYRPHKSPTRDPIIFIHGIGIGLYPYLPFFQDLITATPDQGLLLIELLPISMHISSPPANSLPPVKSLLHGLYTTLDSLGISRAVLASHSYGTVIAAHVLRAQREQQQQHQQQQDQQEQQPPPPPRIRITSHLLIDPIPFLLHLPDVAFNFLYRPPRAANEWQLWYFASRDPDIAYVLGRCFFWAENVLWREDLGLDSDSESESGSGSDSGSGSGSGPHSNMKFAIILSGKDQIIPAPLVRLYLTRETGETRETREDDVKPRWESQSQSHNRRWESQSHNRRWESHNRKLEVLYYPDLDHATVFDTKERRRGMVEVLGRFSVR